MKNILRSFMLTLVLVAGAAFALPPDISFATECIYFVDSPPPINYQPPLYQLNGTCDNAPNTTVYLYSERGGIEHKYAQVSCVNGLWTMAFDPRYYYDGTATTSNYYILDTKLPAGQYAKAPNLDSTQPTMDNGAQVWRDVLAVRSVTVTQGVPAWSPYRFFYPRLCGLAKDERSITLSPPAQNTEINSGTNNTVGAVTPISPTTLNFGPSLCNYHTAKTYSYPGDPGNPYNVPVTTITLGGVANICSPAGAGGSVFEGGPGVWYGNVSVAGLGVATGAASGMVPPGDTGDVRVRASVVATNVWYGYHDLIQNFDTIIHTAPQDVPASDRTWNPRVITSHPYITQNRIVGGVKQPGACNVSNNTQELFNIRCSGGTQVRLINDSTGGLVTGTTAVSCGNSVGPHNVQITVTGYAYNGTTAHLEYTDDFGAWQRTSSWAFFLCTPLPTQGASDWFQ